MLVIIDRDKCSSLFFLKVIDEEKKLNDIDIRGTVRWKGFPKSSSSKVTFFMHCLFFQSSNAQKMVFLATGIQAFVSFHSNAFLECPTGTQCYKT
jgi:hypothetical protein